MLAACEDDLHGLQDRALLMVAYDSMRRRSELISLRVEDIEWIPDYGASILLYKSKTDQQGCGKWIHLTSDTTNALHQWLAAVKINQGLIFRGDKLKRMRKNYRYRLKLMRNSSTPNHL